ncbi:MAG: ABC transporter permease [Thermomicrobiales bacterium]
MRRYVLVRFLSMIPVLWVVTLLVFLVGALIPGDPALVLLGVDATPSQIEAAHRNYGLDAPLPVRYLRWLGHLLQGDLGESFFSRRSVTTLIGQALPVTLQLMLLATAVALAVAVPSAIVSASRRDTWLDVGVKLVAFAGQSVPSFWFGILLISLFAVRLKWLPASGYVAPTEDPAGWLKSLLLPSLTLGLLLAVGLMRYLRASILDVLGLEYVTTARAKGLAERRVMTRHVMRNALIPFTTALGLAFAGLLGGAIVIEQVFALPGMGRLGLDAILARDYRVMQGVVLFVAAGFVVMNFLVDVTYGLLDPRLRTENRR